MNIAFTLIMVVFGVFLFVANRTPEPQRVRVSDLELLNRSYESGEITTQEYLVLLQQLR
jgi:uncharacterized membrane protein